VARILRGLSRSVSPDAIVDAIVEELGVSTGADHIVVVRRGADPAGLVARLVSTRPGVGTSTTRFPLSDLEDPIDGGRARPPVAVPIVREIEDRALVAAPGRAAWVAAEGRGRTSSGLATAEVSSARSRVAAMAGAPGIPSMSRLTGRPGDGGGRGSAGRLGLDASHEWLTMARGMGSTARARLAARARAFVLAAPDAGEEASAAPVPTPTGAADERVAERIATRARNVYALRNTLASPLRADGDVVGAIVLSRRVPGPWPAAARRILAGAAVEASAALARATHHREAETRATTDVLTGLPNRRYFDEFCGLLARRRRADDAVGILLIDIDRFKQVNDTWGHGIGDHVLQSVAGAIAGAVREEDVPARFGGEEFVVLLRNPSREVAIEVGERVRVAVARLDLTAVGVPAVSVSVGVAVATADDQPIPQLVEAADRALYQAKRQGRNRVVAAG
jgi:diguanylate cyclase (GGDEF)-like protein